MEFVALSDTVLRALALDDPQLRRVFQGVYPIGYKLGRDKRYKRMGAKGATGHYRRLPRPWEG